MRLFNEKVFDGFVAGDIFLFTDAMYDELLGTADRLIISAYIDQVSGTEPMWACVSQHSNDKVNWASTDAATEFFDALSPGQPFAGIAASKPAVNLGKYVRYVFALLGADNKAHITLHVCGRGQQLVDVKVPVAPRP